MTWEDRAMLALYVVALLANAVALVEWSHYPKINALAIVCSAVGLALRVYDIRRRRAGP